VLQTEIKVERHDVLAAQTAGRHRPSHIDSTDRAVCLIAASKSGLSLGTINLSDVLRYYMGRSCFLRLRQTWSEEGSL